MKILTSLDHSIDKLPRPIALTIGNFDGMHLGHQMLFDKMKEYTKERGTNAALSFSNHPSHVFSKQVTFPFIYDAEEKIIRFEKIGVDVLYLLTFTQDFANTPYDAFLRTLHKALPFSHLVLGSDAALGKNREGTPSNLQVLGKKLGFTCDFLEKKTMFDRVISSRTIRELILDGNIETANTFLGREYEIKILQNHIKKNKIIVPKTNLLFPKDGQYLGKLNSLKEPVTILVKNQILSVACQQQSTEKKIISLTFLK